MSNNYMTKNDDYLAAESYKIGMGQIFNTPNGVNVNVTSVTSLYENEIITDTDIEILDFIYKCGICVYEQIERFFNGKIRDLKKRVDTLYFNVLINQFILGDKKKLDKKIPDNDDVRFFYCLNSGGLVMLEHFKYAAEYVDWEPGKISMHIANVRKKIIDNEFRLGIKDYDGITEITNQPEYLNRERRINPRSEVRYTDKEGNKKAVLTEVIDRSMPDKMLEDKFRDYGFFLGTQSYKKYFYRIDSKPIILFITEDDNHAIELLDMFGMLSKHADFIITTMERMLGGLSKPGSLMIYEDGTLYEKKSGLFE